MSRVRAIPRQHLVAGLCLLALILYPIISPWEPYPQGVILLGFMLAIQASSWNIISGFAGYISLGHSMFLGLGSYTVAICALRWGVNPLWLMPLGGVTAVVVALLIGSVVLRTSGHAFVIITIAMLLAAQILAVNFKGLTQGSDGITLELPFWNRDYQNIPFYYIFLALLVLTVLYTAWIRRTKFGTGLIAIREDEGKAASIGVNTTRFKIVGYAASAFFIGVAGGVYAYYLTFLNPVGSFAILGSVVIVLAALTGGKGTLYGPVVGAFIVQLASEAATVYGGGSQTRVLLFGAALVAVVLFMPAGLLPTIEARWRKRHPVTIEFTDQAGALGRSPATTRERALEDVAQAVADDLTQGEVLLEVRGASKRFGGLVAVDNASLIVRKGSITGLIGPNGSGKTTLFNLITGGMAADSGEIYLQGQRIDKMPPVIRLKSVVLPDPLGPISPVMDPLRTMRLALSTATRPPNLLEAPRTSRSTSPWVRSSATACATSSRARSRVVAGLRPSAPAWSVNSTVTGCRLRHRASIVGSSPAGMNSTTATKAAPNSSTRVWLPPP